MLKNNEFNIPTMDTNIFKLHSDTNTKSIWNTPVSPSKKRNSTSYDLMRVQKLKYYYGHPM